MEAKSYISGMDLFIGARMHATIAAISSGVPVIPFSYSRKFEGLFSSLGYPYVVQGTKWESQKAIDETIGWIDSLNVLKEEIDACKTIIDEKNSYLLEEYEKLVMKIN
jgi:polysaccharide pyruvyl transferase WcaK-like protein